MNDVTGTTLPPPRKGRSLRGLLLMIGLPFVAGILFMGWGLSRWETARSWLFGAPEPKTLPAISYAPQPSVAPVQAPAALPPDIAMRMADLESRLAHVEASSGSVGAGESGRAEGLLVSFAARRAIDRGLGLGYVEGLLTQRFGATQPRAVATVIAAAKQPATLEQLKAGLEAVAPELKGGGPDEGWWDGFRRGLSGLFVVREKGAVSPDPEARIARASHLVEIGRVDLALAEIARLPNRDRAAGWMTMARRYVEAHRALDLLEAAAITAAAPRAQRPAAQLSEEEPAEQTL